MLIRSHIAVIRVAVTVESIIVFNLSIRVSVWAIKCTMDGMFVVVNWLNIVLIIESVVQNVMSLMVHFMAVLVLICWVAALMVLINAM